MSIQKPGRNSVKATSKSAVDSHTFERSRKNPCVPSVNKNIAMVEMMKTKMSPMNDTFINSWSVLKMNKNGSSALRNG